MALDIGWFYEWYEDKYFPPVWFAPADDSHIPEEELKPGAGGYGNQRREPVRKTPKPTYWVGNKTLEQWEAEQAELKKELRQVKSEVRKVKQKSIDDSAGLELSVLLLKIEALTLEISERKRLDSEARKAAEKAIKAAQKLAEKQRIDDEYSDIETLMLDADERIVAILAII